MLSKQTEIGNCYDAVGEMVFIGDEVLFAAIGNKDGKLSKGKVETICHVDNYGREFDLVYIKGRGGKITRRSEDIVKIQNKS